LPVAFRGRPSVITTSRGALNAAMRARAQEGGISEIDADTIAYHFHEPLGVVGQIIPWKADHAVRQPEPHPGRSGTRREEPGHLFRGRRRSQ
jgi:hypothetical protein